MADLKTRYVVKNRAASYADILPLLLKALQWQGTHRQLTEAQLGRHDQMDLADFQAVLALLGYKTMLRYGTATGLAAKRLPAVLIDAAAVPHLLRDAADIAAHAPRETTLLLVETATADATEPQYATVQSLFTRFRPLLAEITLISLLIGAVALAPTFYNMALYDTVIPGRSTQDLNIYALGVLLALAAEMLLRVLRNRRLGFFAARMDHFISCSVFDRLLFLPPAYTERASVSAQLARLRDFESMREFFTGPLATLFFELPLVAIYTVLMFCLAGPLGAVPVVLTLGYALLIKSMDRGLKDTARAAARATSRRQEFVLETLAKLRAIRLAGLEKTWLQRYVTLSRTATAASYRAAARAQMLETGSYVLMTLGALATIGFGVMRVIAGDMTTGALIAAMLLVWRVVAPLQICCAAISRLQQLRSSAAQVQRLLAMPPEREQANTGLQLKGRITFYRVSLRYTQEFEPALMGVSFDIKPGQVVAIKGDNGSGKSSILKLMLGLYQPQGGAVRFDGIDLRQLDPLALRQSMAYVPQHMEVLPGTIRDNLLYADPDADDVTCRDALQQACALDEVLALPDGLDTVIAGDGAQNIPFLLLQRINLARAYLRPAPIMLFDEAAHSLGLENDIAFVTMIEKWRGRCTVVLATHREDHMRLADTLLVMNRGELTHMGPPDAVLNALRGKN